MRAYLSFFAWSFGSELKALLAFGMVIGQIGTAHTVGQFGGVVVGKEKAYFAGPLGVVLIAQSQGRKIILPQQ